jgi:hypothetical protein
MDLMKHNKRLYSLYKEKLSVDDMGYNFWASQCDCMYTSIHVQLELYQTVCNLTFWVLLLNTLWSCVNTL